MRITLTKRQTNLPPEKTSPKGVKICGKQERAQKLDQARTKNLATPTTTPDKRQQLFNLFSGSRKAKDGEIPKERIM